MQLPKPWPRKPPKYAKCDASVDPPVTRNTLQGDPVIYTCQKQAVETCWWGMETWLCLEHAEALESRNKIVRNPRRKK